MGTIFVCYTSKTRKHTTIEQCVMFFYIYIYIYIHTHTQPYANHHNHYIHIPAVTQLTPANHRSNYIHSHNLMFSKTNITT